MIRGAVLVVQAFATIWVSAHAHPAGMFYLYEPFIFWGQGSKQLCQYKVCLAKQIAGSA